MDNYIKILVSVLVGCLLVGVMVPVIGSMTSTEATYTNHGSAYSLYEMGDTHTITFTADSMITDGVAQPRPDTSRYGSATIAYGSGGLIRLVSNGGIQWWGSVSGEGSNRYIGPSTTTTITISETGVCTASGDNNSRSFSGTIMYANPSGNLALTYNPYVLEDSQIYGCGTTTVDAITYGIYWDGTVEGITANAIVPPTQNFGDIIVNTTNPYTDLLKVDSVVIANETAGENFTYTYFFAPKEITYDNPQYVGVTLSSILDLLPLLAGVCLLMIGVAYFINRR